MLELTFLHLTLQKSQFRYIFKMKKSLTFLKRKGATISKMLEKRESIVSVTSSFSELLDILRNLDNQEDYLQSSLLW